MLSFNTNDYKGTALQTRSFAHFSSVHTIKEKVLNLLDPKAKNQCGGFCAKSCQTLAIPWTGHLVQLLLWDSLTTILEWVGSSPGSYWKLNQGPPKNIAIHLQTSCEVRS